MIMQNQSSETYEQAVMSFINEITELGYMKPDTIIGCDDREIQEIMSAQNITRLPKIYDFFLRKLGKKAGNFSIGDEFLYSSLLYLKQFLIEELEMTPDVTFQLPEQAFVFWMHEGYQFMYFVLDENNDDDDPRVFFWEDNMQQPEEGYPYFSNHLTAWVDGYRRFRKKFKP
jgi:hypothetical protein